MTHRTPNQRRALIGVGALVLLGSSCTASLSSGERRYREGDLRGALSIWSEIPIQDSDYTAAQQRLQEVGDEIDRLVVLHKQRGHDYATQGRLAESVLDYRLALALEPEDDDTLEHVQQQVRLLAKRREALRTAYSETFTRGDWVAARDTLFELEIADPLEPNLGARRRQLSQALNAAISQRMATGRSHFTSGRNDDARGEFEAVLKLDPRNESALGCLAHLDAGPRSGNRVNESQLDRSMAGCATNDEILAEDLYQKALSAERAGELETALRNAQRALSANNNHTRAKAHMELLRLRMNDEVDLLLDQGVHAYREENLQLARDFWQRALLIEPDNERASDYLDRVERQIRNLERHRTAPNDPVE
ncbi:hypothetical protein MK489_12040 [Myxococcota bacterium]|nr:hypothetical protein [Myxococcota bacterium]